MFELSSPKRSLLDVLASLVPIGTEAWILLLEAPEEVISEVVKIVLQELMGEEVVREREFRTGGLHVQPVPIPVIS